MVDNAAMRALRHHVTGAVERGEAEPIEEQRIGATGSVLAETGTPYVSPDWHGPITTCSDCGNPAADELCKRVHNKPDGPLCQPCRNGQLMVHLFCWVCGADKFLWCRTGIVEYTAVESFNDDGEAVIDDNSWTTDAGSGGGTWVECEKCHTHLVDVPYDIG